MSRSDESAATSGVDWPTGPPSAALAELLRALELTVTRRLDGVLHGHYQGLTPGHGSEPGESREYQPGDDVRRIDWNVTARTQQLHVRDQIADRDLEAWLVVDASAAMRFGTTQAEKASIALAAAASIGFLTARNQNRIGAVIAAGPIVRTMPPRHGRDQVRAILQAIASAPSADGAGRSDLGAAIDRVASVSKRRGFVAVIADMYSDGWQRPLGVIAQRHEVLVVDVIDPRELDVPAVGWLSLVDPSTGRQRDVRVTPEVQRRFAEAAAAQRAAVADSIAAAGATQLTLRTDQDWLGAIITHSQHRKVQMVRGMHRAVVR